MNIEHWTLTNKLLTINGKTSLLKTRAKVTELLRPWPNCLFFVSSTKDPWVMMKAVAQKLMFFLPARTQSTSDPHLDPVFCPLGGLLCPAWLLGGLRLVFGLFPLGLLRRPSVLGTFWKFKIIFWSILFIFPTGTVRLCWAPAIPLFQSDLQTINIDSQASVFPEFWLSKFFAAYFIIWNIMFQVLVATFRFAARQF